MLPIRLVLLLCLLGCRFFSASNACAEPKPRQVPAESTPSLAEPEAVAKARAVLLFEKGVSAYREGRFYDAVDIFLETNRLYPDPKLTYNVGKAFEGLGNQPGALRYYREYLRRLPDAPDAPEVEGHAHQLEQALSLKGLQQLTILSKPDGAVLKLDGQAVGVTPWTGETFAGKHRVALEATGYQRTEQVVELDPHRARDFSFELSKNAAKTDPCAASSRLSPRAEPKLSVFTLTTLATGIGLLGTALIAQAAGGGDASGVSRTAAFFAGSGAGVSVLGSMMLYFDLSPSARGSQSSGVSWNASGLEHGMSR